MIRETSLKYGRVTHFHGVKVKGQIPTSFYTVSTRFLRYSPFIGQGHSGKVKPQIKASS